MKNYTVQTPNTCGLAILPTGVSLIHIAGANTGAPDESTFEEFLTLEDAVNRAREIDPSFTTNAVLGSPSLTPLNISNSFQRAHVGSNIVLNCEYSSKECEVTYQWVGLSGLVVPDATSSSLTLEDTTQDSTGTYTCRVNAFNSVGQVSSTSQSFTVEVHL
jgi:hypothetical protein